MATEEKNEDGAAESETPGKAGKSSKKMIIIVSVSVLALVLVIGIPLTILSLGSKKETVDEVDSNTALEVGAGLVAEGFSDEEELSDEEEALGAIMPVETFVVNLAGGGYLRLQFQLEFDAREVPSRFYAKLVPMKDAVLTLLTNRTVEDLSSQKGKEALKSDLKETINRVLKKEDVRQIFFTQFLIK